MWLGPPPPAGQCGRQQTGQGLGLDRTPPHGHWGGPQVVPKPWRCFSCGLPPGRFTVWGPRRGPLSYSAVGPVEEEAAAPAPGTVPTARALCRGGPPVPAHKHRALVGSELGRPAAPLLRRGPPPWPGCPRACGATGLRSVPTPLGAGPVLSFPSDCAAVLDFPRRAALGVPPKAASVSAGVGLSRVRGPSVVEGVVAGGAGSHGAGTGPSARGRGPRSCVCTFAL